MTASDQDSPVALVTGGGQGIGRGIATRLASEGYAVHVNVRDDAKWERLRAEEPELVLHGGDMTDENLAKRLVADILAASGRLDAVIHAVGPYSTSPVSETPATVYRDMIETNLMTAVHLADAARTPLRESRGAALFFGCAGMERWRARSVTTAYIAAKSALLSFVRGFALEEAAHGVRANMISPGFVPHEGAAEDTLAPEMHERIPLGRAASMDEVTGVASFLLSSAAGHVIGQNVEVAGGWML